MSEKFDLKDKKRSFLIENLEIGNLIID